MNRIIVDDALKAKLQHLTAPALLTDAQGNTIAWVTPPVPDRSFDPPLSDDEIKVRLAYDGPTHSMDEVRRMLEDK